MIKHKLEKWDYDHNLGELLIYDTETRSIVARVDVTNENAGDHAQLIAAAPDLLAACKAVLPTLTNTVGGRATTQHKMAEKAIAKAEAKR